MEKFLTRELDVRTLSSVSNKLADLGQVTSHLWSSTSSSFHEGIGPKVIAKVLTINFKDSLGKELAKHLACF